MGKRFWGNLSLWNRSLCLCGSLCIKGLTEDEVKVSLLGGDLHIRYDKDNNLVYMTGDADGFTVIQFRRKKGDVFSY